MSFETRVKKEEPVMKSHFSKYAALVSLAFLAGFAACGKSSYPERFSQLEDTDPVSAAKLTGRWNSGCLPTVSGESRISVVKARLYRVQFLSGGLYIYEEFAYSDSVCRDRVFTSYGEGSFSVKSNGTIVSQLLGYQQVTPLDDDGVTAMNRASICGYNSWRNNTPRDIMLSSCAPVRTVESGAGFRENGELVLNLCAPKISSTAKCESFFFTKQ